VHDADDQRVTELWNRAEIAEVLSLYGFLMDDRDWVGLARVFTDDVHFDASDLGLGTVVGLEALRAAFAGMHHPIGHHATNHVISIRQPDHAIADVVSKWLAPRREGLPSTGEYRDEFVLTPDGWRIRSRTLTLRRPREDSL
jgi:hypothetical protein